MPGEADQIEDIVDENEELLLETEAPDDDIDLALDATADEDGDETVLTLGDEPEPDAEEETPLIRQLRKQLREQKRQNRELAHAPAAAAPVVELGPEPDFDDFDYDSEAFKAAHTAWVKQSLAHERQQAEAKAAREKADTEWQGQLATYEKRKAALAIPGKEEAEEEALSKLSQLQQAIIVKHPNNAAIMIALGKYPKKLEAVAAVSDPVNFTYAIGDIGRELKVTARRKAPEPDTPVRGSGTLSGASAAREKEKDKIYDQMAKGGDVTKLRARLKQIDAR